MLSVSIAPEISCQFLQWSFRFPTMNRPPSLLTIHRTYKVKLDLTFIYDIWLGGESYYSGLEQKTSAVETKDPAAKSIPELSRMPSLNGESGVKGSLVIVLGMGQWLGELGHSVSVDQFSGVSWCWRQQAASINNLNIIHVAGIKGKGSTCCIHRFYSEIPRETS